MKIRADDGFVFRTPLLPVTALLAWAQAPDPQRYLMELVTRPEIREAIYVASPSLSEAIDAWLAAPAANQRVGPPVAKYVARMMGRATPFGLFSGVSVGKLGRETALRLVPRAEYRRRTRIDNDYLFVLVAALAEQPAVRANLTYRPSTSLYRVAGRWRYAEARLDGADRSYHLVSVEPTPYLDATLERAAAGARYDELVTPLVAGDITLDEAREYIDQLLAAQVLVPDLGVYITGPEPIDGLLAQLRAAGLDEPWRVLDEVRSKIQAIDARGLGNAPESYQAIERALEPLPGRVTRSRLFQVDMVKPAAATLSTRVAADVASVIAQLGQIRAGRGAMDEFKTAFRTRWEDRTVPLLEVLDEESGIGFEVSQVPGAEGAPLLAGLPLGAGSSEPRVPWSRFEVHMLRRLAPALASGAAEIVLDDTDIEAMKLPTAAVLPDAFSVMVRLASDELMVEGGTSGPSGARILGRFCHASPEIDEMIRAHHAAEEALRPDALFAEIVHLNEGRIGNILCRPVMREHEVVYLGISGAPRDKQITLDDLLVSVRGDRIVLTSRRLGKEVVPRLTTAHNYRLRSLGPYRFLCALATQDRDNVGWSWGVLGSAPFLPRVRIGRVIVSRAEWNLAKRDIEPITNAVRAANKTPSKRPDVAAAVAALREARALPRMFVVASADNELPIDLDNPLLVAAFADEVSGSEVVQLTELFPAPDRTVVGGPEGSFSNEIVLTFTRQPDKTAPAPLPVTPVPAIQRSFAPGSEWLYAKIYCGSSTGDRVLRDLVGPVARAAIAAGDAREWFFIRYQDPDPHIRVRFRGEPGRLCAAVLPALERAYAQLAGDGSVHKLVLDTYVRETERYGGDHGIELVEQLFWRDSEAVLAIIELLDGDAGAVARWKLCVRGIDSMLEAIGLLPEQRAKICAEAKESIGRELNAGTLTWSKIGGKFTRDRADLEVMFDRDPARDAAHEYAPGFAILAERDAAIRELAVELRRREAAGALSPGLESFAWSLVHMHANRLLHASQRAQEMVLYDFVRRLHAAKKARAR
jgi:thiopeptide-type bacteriocin biosynthesis protein